MKVVILLVVLLLTNCSATVPTRMTQLPYYKNAWQVQPKHDSFPDPNKVARVINIFYQHWVMEFGDSDKEILNNMQSIMIEWRDDRPSGTGYNMHGSQARGVLKGVALSPGYIWVWKGQYKRIAATALVHELIHVALWVQNGAPDSDHEGNKYYGWTKRHTEFMHRVNYLLAEIDL